MSARVEITRKYAKEYVRASKEVRGKILDDVCQVTGWSRDNARRRLRATLKSPTLPSLASSSSAAQTRSRERKYSLESRSILERVWKYSGGICGKYLHASMSAILDNLEAHQILEVGMHSYSHGVKEELIAMSPATIDRYLQPLKEKDPFYGFSTTTPGPLLRNSISIRRASDEVEQLPGFFEVDTVAHCGPTLKNEFIRTLNMTDMHTGWVFTRSIRNNAHIHIKAALNRAIEVIPFPMTGIDTDNGSEFINHGLVEWTREKDIYFTRSRPYQKNDQATIESKNHHVVRKYGYYCRYDTPTELDVLNQLWAVVNDRLNFFTPTKKPSGYSSTKLGKRRRLYDSPRTPLDRVLASGILTEEKISELREYHASLNLAAMTDQILKCQHQLIHLAGKKTQLLEQTLQKPLPDINKGIRTKK